MKKNLIGISITYTLIEIFISLFILIKFNTWLEFISLFWIVGVTIYAFINYKYFKNDYKPHIILFIKIVTMSTLRNIITYVSSDITLYVRIVDVIFLFVTLVLSLIMIIQNKNKKIDKNCEL